MRRRELFNAVREHRLRRVLRGVYVDASVADTRELRIAAMKLVAPSHAVVCDSSASWVFGVDTFRPSDRFVLTPSLVIPHGATRVTHRQVQCREAYIDERDIVEVGSLLVTNPLRTTSDLLRKLRRPYALAAADGLVRAGVVSAEEVGQYILRLRRFPGIVQAKQLVNFIDPGAESPAESWTRLRLLDAGFPRPDTQIIVADRHGRELVRLDMGYDGKLIAAEYDGVGFHTAPEDQAHDEKRRAYLRNTLGWRISVVGKDSVLGPDHSLEVEIGQWLGIDPDIPRSW